MIQKIVFTLSILILLVATVFVYHRRVQEPSREVLVYAIRNATYSSQDYGGTMKFVEGSYEKQANLEQGDEAMQFGNIGTIVSDDENAAPEEALRLSDVDHDGDLDGVVVYGINGGGTGHFMYLTVLLNTDGAVQQATSTYLGDRTIVHGIDASDNRIHLDLTIWQEGDGACCPSRPFSFDYEFTSGALRSSGEELPLD